MSTQLEFFQEAKRRGKTKAETIAAFEKLKAQGVVFDDESIQTSPSGGPALIEPLPEQRAGSISTVGGVEAQQQPGFEIPGKTRVGEAISAGQTGPQGQIPISSVLGLPSRAAGAVGEKLGIQPTLRSAFGQPERESKPFLETIAEPSTGLLEPVRTASENLPGALRIPINIATGVLEDPSVFIGGGAAVARRAATKLGRRGVSKAALTSKEGFRFTPHQIKPSPKRGLKETRIQHRPRLSVEPERINAENIETLQRVTGEKLQKLGSTSQPAEAGELVKGTGGRLERGLQQVKKEAGEQFRKVEAEEISPFKKTKLPGKEVEFKKVKESPLIDPKTGKPLQTIETFKKMKTDASNLIDRKLAEKGFKPGSEISEKFGVSSDAIKKSLDFKDEIGKAETIGDLVSIRRNLRSKLVKERRREGVFGQLTKDEVFLDDIDSALRTEIANSVEKTVSKDAAEILRLNNQLYAKNKTFVQGLTDKIPVGKNMNEVKIVDALKKLSSEDLFKLNQLAKEEAFKPVVEEMRRGVFENLVAKSMNAQTGKVSSDKIVTQWNALKKGVDVEQFFGKGFSKEMDETVESLITARKGNIRVSNPSGTAKNIIQGQQKFWIKDLADAITAKIAMIGVKRYYREGTTISESFLNSLGTVGGKMTDPDGLKFVRELVAANVTLREIIGND